MTHRRFKRAESFRKLCFLVPQHYMAINPNYPIKRVLRSRATSQQNSATDPPQNRNEHVAPSAPQACLHAYSNTHQMPSTHCAGSEEVHTRNYRIQTNLVPTWTELLMGRGTIALSCVTRGGLSVRLKWPTRGNQKEPL